VPPKIWCLPEHKSRCRCGADTLLATLNYSMKTTVEREVGQVSKVWYPGASCLGRSTSRCRIKLVWRGLRMNIHCSIECSPTQKSGMPDTVKCLRKIERINNNIFVSA